MSVVGLDVGTSAVKAVRFDDDGLRAADVATEATTVLRPAGGRREQDMGEVRAAAFRVLGQVVQRSPDPVRALAVTAQGDGCWLVDADGAPTGPALLWNDNRAAGIVEDWQADGTLVEAFGRSGSLGAPGLPNAQLRWLAEHEPDRLAGADRVLTCGSWIHSQLTGRRVLEISDAANPFCSAEDGEYDDRLLELFGLTEQRRLLPDLVRLEDAVAPLGDAAAAELGLRPGTPTVLAPYDVVATGIGCGATRPGQSFAVLGTTLCVGVCADDPQLDREPSGMTLPVGDVGRWFLAYATLTGTEALDWLARTSGTSDVRAMVRSADDAESPDVPLFLPYLSPAGERAPFLDAGAQGGLVGVRTHHGPPQLVRSVLEGLTCAVAECLVASRSAAHELTVCGGGARSDLWCRLLADATGVEVRRPAVEEVGAFGAVLYAATVLGEQDALGGRAGPPTEQVFSPSTDGTARMRDTLDALVRTREALRAARN